MPRKCTVCVHPERVAVERAIANGESLSAVGSRFGLNRNAVYRHVANHLVWRPSLRLLAVQVIHSLVQRLEEWLRKLLRDRARATADPPSAPACRSSTSARTFARRVRVPSRVAGRPKRALLVRAKRDKPMSATVRDAVDVFGDAKASEGGVE